MPLTDGILQLQDYPSGIKIGRGAEAAPMRRVSRWFNTKRKWSWLCCWAFVARDEVRNNEVEHGEVFGTGLKLYCAAGGLISEVLSCLQYHRSNVDEQSCGTTAATSDASADDVFRSHWYSKKFCWRSPEPQGYVQSLWKVPRHSLCIRQPIGRSSDWVRSLLRPKRLKFMFTGDVRTRVDLYVEPLGVGIDRHTSVVWWVSPFYLVTMKQRFGLIFVIHSLS